MGTVVIDRKQRGVKPRCETAILQLAGQTAPVKLPDTVKPMIHFSDCFQLTLIFAR